MKNNCCDFAKLFVVEKAECWRRNGSDDKTEARLGRRKKKGGRAGGRLV